MTDAGLLWTQYAAVSGLIVYAGSRTVRHADRIAELTGLGRGWIGLTLVALMTSLPELITGASSVLWFDVPDIAAGDIYGSLVFNLLLVALLDALSPRPLFAALSPLQTPRAWAALGMACLAWIALAAADSLPALGWIGLESLVFVAAYAVALWRLRPQEVGHAPGPGTGPALVGTWVRFGLHGSVVVAAATYLPYLGAELSEATGLLHTFVGNLLVAASTSMPELVTSIAAVRMGALDLAMGNLLGSNLFDVVVLAFDDALYTSGPLLDAVSPRHLISATAAVLMSGITVLALHRRSSRRFILSPESWLLVASYGVTVLAFFRTD